MAHREFRRRRGERGFTLVELMYATFYFEIGLAALASFQIVAASGSGRARDISEATNLAASTIELVRATSVQTVLTAGQPLVATYDRYGNLTSTAAFYTVGIPTTIPTSTYFTITATCTPVTGMAYYEIIVNTNWKQRPSDTFIHGIALQTRIPTE